MQNSGYHISDSGYNVPTYGALLIRRVRNSNPTLSLLNPRTWSGRLPNSFPHLEDKYRMRWHDTNLLTLIPLSFFVYLLLP